MKSRTKNSKPPATMLSKLNADESANVLTALLQEHPGLCQRAEQLASAVVADSDIEAISEEVFMAVSSVDIDEVYGRAGKHKWGYVSLVRRPLNFWKKHILTQ